MLDFSSVLEWAKLDFYPNLSLCSELLIQAKKEGENYYITCELL